MQKSNENHSRLPIQGREVQDKIYVHPETGHEVNLGPLFEVLDDECRWDRRTGIDEALQSAIKLMNEMAGLLPLGERWPLDNGKYSDAVSILYRLKDALCLLEREPVKG